MRWQYEIKINFPEDSSVVFFSALCTLQQTLQSMSYIKSFLDNLGVGGRENFSCVCQGTSFNKLEVVSLILCVSTTCPTKLGLTVRGVRNTLLSKMWHKEEPSINSRLQPKKSERRGATETERKKKHALGIRNETLNLAITSGFQSQ